MCSPVDLQVLHALRTLSPASAALHATHTFKTIIRSTRLARPFGYGFLELKAGALCYTGTGVRSEGAAGAGIKHAGQSAAPGVQGTRAQGRAAPDNLQCAPFRRRHAQPMQGLGSSK